MVPGSLETSGWPPPALRSFFRDSSGNSLNRMQTESMAHGPWHQQRHEWHLCTTLHWASSKKPSTAWASDSSEEWHAAACHRQWATWRQRTSCTGAQGASCAAETGQKLRKMSRKIPRQQPLSSIVMYFAYFHALVDVPCKTAASSRMTTPAMPEQTAN